MKRLLVVLVFVSATMFAAVSIGHSDSSSRLSGNHPVQAEQRAAIANMDASAPLTMEINPKLRNEAQLDKFLDELQDPHSPNYHKFLQPGEFDRKYGALPSQVKAIADWLRDEGFTVTSTSGTVQFIGTVAQAENTFAVRIMKLSASEYSNLDDPMVPARFASLIGHIEGLDNMMTAAPITRTTRKLKTMASAAGAHKLTRAEALSRVSGGASALASVQPNVDIGGGVAYGDVDMRNTYDVPSDTTLGSGDCIGIVGTSDFLDGSLTTFANQFSDLAPFNVTRVLVGANPGIKSEETESDLDLEWSHVMAPGAATRFYLGNNLTNDITKAIKDDTCKVISISYEYCGTGNSFFTKTLDPLFKKAAAQGQSVFVSTGDSGAAGSVATGGQCVPGSMRMVSEMAADPFVTAVGGTEILSPDYNGEDIAQGYATETVWNDPQNGFLAGGATGGGASAIFSKPSYQSGPGVPEDNQRDIPDVAMLSGSPRVFLGGDAGGATLLCCYGGTSLAAPLWAGLAKDIEAQLGPLGSINSAVYALANLQYGSSHTPQGFHDITSGDNSFQGVAGFSAGTAYNQATGWGSVDYGAFADAYKNFIGPVTTSMTAAPLRVNFGSVDMRSSTKARKITIINKGKKTAVIATVSVSAGFTITADTCSNQNVAAKKRCVVSIEFSPATYGSMSGSMMAPYNGGIATSTLLGNGIDLVEGPASVKFAPVAAGMTSPAKIITLTNETPGITVTMGTTPSINGPFGVVSGTDTCSGATLKPHAHCTIKVTAMPPADSPSGDPIAGSLGPFTFTYPSNSGTVPAVQLSGEAK